MAFPTGTVTFLFTDIEGSTQLWEQFPELMKGALARHDAILREAVESGHGQIVKTTGDGIHAVFVSAAAAVQTILAAQRTLLATPWPENMTLRVRSALHSGEAQWREGDYYGSEVNRAARLMSLASESQILLSTATAALTRDRLPAGATLRDLGSFCLRSLAHPEHIYQLLHPDLPADFPPLVSYGEAPNNLPQQLTSFIGREREIDDVKQLLAPDRAQDQAAAGQARLISLIGPGGTGKTRLSLQVGMELLESFPDGVWLVELAPLSDPQFVVQTVAAPLGLSDQPGRPLLDRLADALRSRKLLLILDNCEHLIDACAELAESLLRACPDLRVLASSREALGIPGEQTYRVRSLALPPIMDDLPPAELAGYEAVRLFVQRAAAVRTGFTLTSENTTSVLQICRRLDGIPLAIELAAARSGVLTPEEIAARLDNRFRLLTGGSRTALPRQRTLQALIDWSYDLLSEPECILFRRLSVFVGGRTLEAAESVAGAAPLEPFEVLDLLEQLVSKSLIVAERSDLGMRYGFLETIRQYAQEKLAQSGEADEMRDRHLDYFVGQSQQAMQAVWELRGGDWMKRLGAESDNLRSARSWALEHHLQAAMQLAAGFLPQFNQVTPDAEALRYLEVILAKAESSRDFSGADARPENRRLLGAVLASAGGVTFRLGFNPLALDYHQRSATIAREVGDLGTLAWVQGVGSSVAGIMGDLETARRMQDESRALAGGTSPGVLAMGLIGGLVLTASSDGDEAWDRWEKGMVMLRQGNESSGLGLGHLLAAFTCVSSGDEVRARFHAERALFYFDEIDAVHFANVPRSVLAELARKDGELEQAERMYREIVQVWRDKGNAGAAARCLECLAFIAHAKSADEKQPAILLAYAATLLGAADAVRRESHSPMTAVEQPEYDAELAAIQNATDDDFFQTAWKRGQRMDLDQAVNYALSAQEKG